MSLADRRSIRPVVVVLTALVVLAISVWSAEAVTKTYSFSLKTTGGTFAGSASTVGKVTFTGSKTGTISGTVTDNCPGDGAGAYVRLSVTYGNGTIRNVYPFASDSNGCGNGSISYNKAIPNPNSLTVASVVVGVCVTDQQSNFNCQEAAYSPLYDNPNV